MTGRDSVLGAFGRWAQGALRRSGRTLGGLLAVALRLVLMVAGFAAVTYGVWSAVHWLGWIVGGVSLLVIEAMVKRR